MNVLQDLKEQTAPYHIQIEKNPYAASMMDKTMTLEGYITYLQKFYGFIAPVEEAIAQLPGWETNGFDFDLRRKAPLIEQDLRQLGLSEQQIAQLPRSRALPDVSTFPRALGYLYVIEGSTLGGQVITKQLKKFLPIETELNGRYFNSYGEEVRVRWGEFRALVEQTAGSDEAASQTIEAAKETFILLDQWVNASE
ncbi:heme oxygenase [Paenibacillus phyllosphaerae]|uniref:Heme oxygenase n=1 Tax=Paenibacillus phyllosphaerae TaxID=274593 RepID=A0A7W5AYJ3_9BACL|nr:biliverdin-producing heme oxygenase [Paenibacillus phyllosphaerae]MBB3111098.1 heme oxygenase [Paenibacillus phyllosphaerae]